MLIYIEFSDLTIKHKYFEINTIVLYIEKSPIFSKKNSREFFLVETDL